MHDVLWRVATEDVVQALTDGHRLTVRTGGEVGQNERIQKVLPRPIEASQFVCEPPFVCLVLRTGVKRHQGDDLVGCPNLEEMLSAVNGVHARSAQPRCVPNVMEQRGRDQHLSRVSWRRDKPFGGACNAQGMGPSIAQLCGKSRSAIEGPVGRSNGRHIREDTYLT
jgi:hypothetical protein